VANRLGFENRGADLGIGAAVDDRHRASLVARRTAEDLIERCFNGFAEDVEQRHLKGSASASRGVSLLEALLGK